MNSFLIFLAVLAGMVIFALVINKLTGRKAYYIDANTLLPGESVRFEDRGADFYRVAELGQAVVMSFARMKRTHLIVTNLRIIVGEKVLFMNKHMITNVIYFRKSDVPQGVLEGVWKGNFSRGYAVLLADCEKTTAEIDGKKSYVRLVPEATPSAFNIEHCRLYTESADGLLKVIRHAGA